MNSSLRKRFNKASQTRKLLLGLLALSISACSPVPAADACGADTEERFGQCVVVAPPEARCGEGTTLDADRNICEPTIVCGDGTLADVDTGLCDPISECGPDTFLNLESLECVPQSECGEGTVGDPERRECVSVVTCGPGTILNEEENICDALAPCEEGAVLNPANNQCEADQSCGPGLVVTEGVCTEPDQAILLEVDIRESAPDRNDPTYGGTPQRVVLEALSERLVFYGIIDRPADVGGNGDLVQDRDVWRFRGQKGDLLDVGIVSFGLPQPAFVIEGPNNFRRSSTLGYESSPSRWVMLPYDGDYDLTVAPSAFLLSEQPIGAQDAGYVVSIEKRPLPGRLVLAPGSSFDASTERNGDLLDSSDNFFTVDAPNGTPVVVGISGDFGSTQPALIAFNRDLELINHVQEFDEDGGYMGVVIKEDAFVVVDWTDSVAPIGDYALELYTPPLINRGTVPPDFNTVTARHEIIPGRSAGAFRFTLEALQVSVCEANGEGVFRNDLQVVGPNGQAAVYDDAREFFFLAPEGEYTVFMMNDGTGDDTDVSLTVQALTPADLGALDPSDPANGSSASGELLTFGFGGYKDAWAVMQTPRASMLELDFRAEAGDPVLSVFNVGGEVLRTLAHPHLGKSMKLFNGDTRPLLVRIEPDGTNLVNWSLDVHAEAIPEFRDAEPNDTRALAVNLGAPPHRLRGLMEKDERDVYRIRLDAPLREGQVVEVLFDNVQSDSESTFSDSTVVNIFDAAFVGIPTLPQAAPIPGITGVNTVTFAPSYDVGTEFYVELFGDNVTAPTEQEYVLDIRVIDAVMEIEPNDTSADADALPSAPSVVYGYRGVDDEDDVFVYTLTEDLPPDTSLVFELKNLETQNIMSLVLSDDNGVELARARRLYPQLQVSSLVAGPYFVSVEDGTGGLPNYALSVREGGRVEAEPNGVPSMFSNDMGVLTSTSALTWTGTTNSIDEDFFTFSLAAPLSPEQSLRAEVINLDDGSPISMAMAMTPAFESSSFLEEDKGPQALLIDRLVGTGPFGLKVLGERTEADRYRVKLYVGDASEAEPNDTPETATPLALGQRIDLTLGGGTQLDVFSFDVPAGQNDYPVSVFMENLSDGTSIELSVRDTDFDTELGGGTGFRVRQNLSLDSGTYWVVLESRSDSQDVSDHVILEVVQR